MSEWQAYLSQHRGEFLRQQTRVILHRRIGDTREIIKGFDHNGWAIVEAQSITDAVSEDEPLGFVVPTDALEAIAEAIKPGPSRAEMKRLEEALAVERARVDGVLGLIVQAKAECR